MAVTTAFLNSCRTQIVASAEYTAFNTAYAAYASASRASKPGYWHAAFGDNQAGLSPAYRLNKLIRDTIRGLADSTISPSEYESAYRTLSAEYVPDTQRPNDANEERAALQQALIEDAAS